MIGAQNIAFGESVYMLYNLLLISDQRTCFHAGIKLCHGKMIQNLSKVVHLLQIKCLEIFC